MRVLLAVVVVWATIFVVPFVIYAAGSAALDLKPPTGSVLRFLLGVGLTKLGTAAAFVALFLFCKNEIQGHWVIYACIWFLMFALSEIGDVVKTGYTVAEAVLGILSEAVYTPLSALTVERLFR